MAIAFTPQEVPAPPDAMSSPDSGHTLVFFHGPLDPNPNSPVTLIACQRTIERVMDQDDGRELSRLSSAWDSRLDSFFHGAFLTALILMALVTGAVLTAADIFPGPQIVRAYQGDRKSTRLNSSH